jgi:Uma2 family endonuclease
MDVSIQSKSIPGEYGENLFCKKATQPLKLKPVEELEFIDDLTDDEEDPPLESDWHVAAMALLVNTLRDYWAGCPDIYVSGNTVVRVDPSRKRKFRGPDLYIVKGVKDKGFRSSWTSWEEQDQVPNFILELASKSTAHFDVTGKKKIYEKELKTPEYVVYNPHNNKLQGWRLVENRYQAIEPNQKGQLWCDEMGLWLGVVSYQFFKDLETVKTPRFFDKNGQLIPTRDETERMEKDIQTEQAEKAEQRAKKAEAEIAQLRALLAKKDKK